MNESYKSNRSIIISGNMIETITGTRDLVVTGHNMNYIKIIEM